MIPSDVVGLALLAALVAPVLAGVDWPANSCRAVRAGVVAAAAFAVVAVAGFAVLGLASAGEELSKIIGGFCR